MKAFGYGNYALGFHYLKLAFVVVLCGVVLGIAGGWYFGLKITELYMQFFRFPVLRYSPGSVVIGTAILVSLGAASIGALAAVRRAINLPPAEAMRPEMPAGFRRFYRTSSYSSVRACVCADNSAQPGKASVEGNDVRSWNCPRCSSTRSWFLSLFRYGSTNYRCSVQSGSARRRLRCFSRSTTSRGQIRPRQSTGSLTC